MANIDQVETYLQAGLSIIPILCDGSKVPAIDSWKPYQRKPATSHEVRQWYGNGADWGIAAIGGKVSNQLEILDFDEASLFEPWFELCLNAGLEKSFLDRLPRVRTPNGWHIYYRCSEIAGNTKLAQRKESDAKLQTLIETRGEGGYCILPGSPASCHPDKKEYVLMNGSFADIPMVTTEQRRTMLDVAASFNEHFAEAYTPADKVNNGVKPGDDYNDRADWRSDILISAGCRELYSKGVESYWAKPGSNSRAPHATLNWRGLDKLYVFSSSFPGLEPLRAYDKFQTYTYLFHIGNFAEAAKALAALGYGKVNQIDDEKSKRPSQRDVLLSLAESVELWRDSSGAGYATVQVDSHFENGLIRSRWFKDWLRKSFYDMHKNGVSNQALEEALGTIESRARFEGKEYVPFFRIGETPGKVYVDLGDASWQVVEIDSTGFRLLAKSPVKFIRRQGQLPLPIPAVFESLRALNEFQELFGLEKLDWILCLAWLFGALRPKGPYPILQISGERDSGKSTLLEYLRRVIDPKEAMRRGAPREERDLLVAAKSSWIVSFDNLSGIKPEIADALCRLSTGGGGAYRTLFSDDEETTFEFQRPIIANGIEQPTIRGDYLDRVIGIELKPIAEDKRIPEGQFKGAFESLHPRVLGALFQAVSESLRNESTQRPAKLPRLADFALWVYSGAKCLGFSSSGQNAGDIFLDAYNENRNTLSRSALEVPIAEAIAKLSLPFEGRASELLKLLKKLGEPESLPANASKLGGQLRRLAPDLRRSGYKISFRSKNRRIEISRVPQSDKLNNLAVPPIPIPEALTGAEYIGTGNGTGKDDGTGTFLDESDDGIARHQQGTGKNESADTVETQTSIEFAGLGTGSTGKVAHSLNVDGAVKFKKVRI